MAIEKRIYSPWAFQENENEKRKMNIEIYNELKDKTQIIYQSQIDKMSNEEYETLKKEKTLIQNAGAGYAHQKYQVISNPHDLSQLELALVADGGNLCFGYRIQGGLIIIYTD
jgi:hypothetical protein